MPARGPIGPALPVYYSLTVPNRGGIWCASTLDQSAFSGPASWHLTFEFGLWKFSQQLLLNCLNMVQFLSVATWSPAALNPSMVVLHMWRIVAMWRLFIPLIGPWWTHLLLFLQNCGIAAGERSTLHLPGLFYLFVCWTCFIVVDWMW